MYIEPNLLLIGLQAVPFLLTILALYVIIFKPMLAYLDEREEAMTRGREEAAALQTQIQDDMNAYTTRLAAAKREMVNLRKQRRAEATVEHDARLAASRVEAEGRIAAAIDEIEAEVARARSLLAGTADTLADDIAGQVLGRPLATAAPSQPPAGEA